MTPGRIRGWLNRKIPAGAKELDVAVELPARVSSIISWTREEVDALDNPRGDELLGPILEATQDHTDAADAKCKFVIRWMSGKRVLSQTSHHCRPQPQEQEEAVPLTESALTLKLLDHLDNREKHIQAMSSGYEKVIAMLTDKLDAAYSEKASVVAQATEVLAAPVELTEEQREELLTRTAAWRRLTDVAGEKVPDAFDAMIAWFAQRYIPENAPESKPNGKSGKGKGKQASK